MRERISSCPDFASGAEPNVVGDARGPRHDDHALADLQGLVDRMRDEHGGLAVLAHEAREFLTQPLTGDLVERGERLVAQQNAGVGREGARDADALAHPAGQCVRIILLVAGKAEAREPELRHVAALGRGLVQHLQPKLDIADRGAPRQQPVVLEHDRDLAAQIVEIPEWIEPLHAHRAFGRLHQPGDEIEGRGLAASGLAEQRNHLAARDIEAEPVDRAERLGAIVLRRKPLRHPIEMNFGVRRHSARSETAR